MTELLDRVRQDITPFLDPGTTLNEAQSGRHATLSWVSRGEVQEVTFSFDGPGSISAFIEGQTVTYSAFLSKISDMLGLARTILQMRTAEFFVSTQARSDTQSTREDGSSTPVEKPAIELLQQNINPNKEDVTKVVFVTGDAGAGKTEVLKQLVYKQAESYVKGDADFLYLYVNAQGRALARLDEALATEIQDLRATKITYHVIPALTRNGIMVPLIDGFDELLGVLGYEDAFSSLRRFLDELNGQGTLIASARSTYYQQEFIARSGRSFATNQRVEVEQVDIVPWNAPQFEDFLTQRYSAAPSPRMSLEHFRAEMRQAFSAGESADLKTKPFFISKIASLILSGVAIEKEDLVDNLVVGYVERERNEKLLDKNGALLLSTEQIFTYLQMVSEEMWITETRALHSESLRILAELAFPISILTGDSAHIVRERAPTMAFFSPASGRDRVEFEHEIFFSYFLGDTICRDFIAGPTALHRCLSRAQLPDFAPRFASNKILDTQFNIEAILKECAVVGDRFSSRPSQVRENCGALVFAAFQNTIAQRGSLDNLEIRSLVFAGGYWNNLVLNRVSVSDTVFVRTDLTQAKFSECLAKNVSLQDVVFDPETTKFDVNGIDPDFDVYGIRVRNKDRTDQIFRRDKIRDVLTNCGMFVETPANVSKVSAAAGDLLEKLLKKFERSTLFWPNDIDNQQITLSPMWDMLASILFRCKALTRESIAHKGTPRPALKRNFLPVQIMEGEDGRPVSSESIGRFWEEMRENFPSQTGTN